MPVFRVTFSRESRIEIEVEAKTFEQVEKAAENTVESGELDRTWDTGFDDEWSSCVWPKPLDCEPNHGLKWEDDRPIIVNITDAEPEPPETDEERAAREYAEAEAAGQQRLPLAGT